MRRRGFTLVELAITISISAVMIPAVFLLLRTAEANARRALSRARTAESMRTFSEELRRDLRTMRFVNDTGLVLAGPGCEARYELRGSILVRAGCDGARAVARDVASVERTAWGAEVVFAQHVAPPKEPIRTRYRIAFGVER